MATKDAPEVAWARAWLEGVVRGERTMSQRKLATIEARGGGLSNVRAIARAKGVHLLVLEDDEGTVLVAASMRPFKVVC